MKPSLLQLPKPMNKRTPAFTKNYQDSNTKWSTCCRRRAHLWQHVLDRAGLCCSTTTSMLPPGIALLCTLRRQCQGKFPHTGLFTRSMKWRGFPDLKCPFRYSKEVSSSSNFSQLGKKHTQSPQISQHSGRLPKLRCSTLYIPLSIKYTTHTDGLTWTLVKYLPNKSAQVVLVQSTRQVIETIRDRTHTASMPLPPKIHNTHFQIRRKEINRITLSYIYTYTHVYIYTLSYV